MCSVELYITSAYFPAWKLEVHNHHSGRPSIGWRVHSLACRWLRLTMAGGQGARAQYTDQANKFLHLYNDTWAIMRAHPCDLITFQEPSSNLITRKD